MKRTLIARITGLLFVLGAVVVNVPYMLLIANFDYPDILRQPVGEILTAFAQGGSGLIFTWLAFAWSGLPVLLALRLLPDALERPSDAALKTATTLGVIGGVVQIIGLLRWVFVIPGLAQAYVDPQAGEAARAAAGQVFQAVHQFGGVLLGEHMGQIFTIAWMLIVSASALRGRFLPRWLALFGLAASLVYFLAQGELLATVIPDFPQLGWAGLIGSILWLVWMLALGLFLLLPRRRA